MEVMGFASGARESVYSIPGVMGTGEKLERLGRLETGDGKVEDFSGTRAFCMVKDRKGGRLLTRGFCSICLLFLVFFSIFSVRLWIVLRASSYSVFLFCVALPGLSYGVVCIKLSAPFTVSIAR